MDIFLISISAFLPFLRIYNHFLSIYPFWRVKTNSLLQICFSKSDRYRLLEICPYRNTWSKFFNNKEFACKLLRGARLRSNNYLVRAPAILAERFLLYRKSGNDFHTLVRQGISYKVKKRVKTISRFSHALFTILFQQTEDNLFWLFSLSPESYKSL